jgi:hypothetical protein
MWCPGHRDFIGPLQPGTLGRHGAIRFDHDGTAYFELLRDIPKFPDWGRQPGQ